MSAQSLVFLLSVIFHLCTVLLGCFPFYYKEIRSGFLKMPLFRLILWPKDWKSEGCNHSKDNFCIWLYTGVNNVSNFSNRNNFWRICLAYVTEFWEKIQFLVTCRNAYVSIQDKIIFKRTKILWRWKTFISYSSISLSIGAVHLLNFLTFEISRVTTLCRFTRWRIPSVLALLCYLLILFLEALNNTVPEQLLSLRAMWSIHFLLWWLLTESLFARFLWWEDSEQTQAAVVCTGKPAHVAPLQDRPWQLPGSLKSHIELWGLIVHFLWALKNPWSVHIEKGKDLSWW